MNKLTLSELKELAQVLVVANTPASLTSALLRSAAMAKLKTGTPKELLRLYDALTARADRNEVVMALAYALLCAVLIKARDASNTPIDETRLNWGSHIKAYLSIRPNINTETFSVQIEAPANAAPGPLVSTLQTTGVATTTARLVGPRGEQLIWRPE